MAPALLSRLARAGPDVPQSEFLRLESLILIRTRIGALDQGRARGGKSHYTEERAQNNAIGIVWRLIISSRTHMM